MDSELSPERRELLKLRARIVVLEKASLAALELALRIRPEALNQTLHIARQRLDEAYHDVDFAHDVHDPAERAFLSAEVDTLMSSLQAEMGFKGGKLGPENG